MKSITFLAILLFSFVSQAQDQKQEITNRVFSILTVKRTGTPKEFPVDNDLNYLQIENGEAIVNYRSRGAVTFYQGSIKNYEVSGEKISFYLAPTGLGSKPINLEILPQENGQYQIHLFDKMNGSRDVYLIAELASKDIFNQ